MIAYSSIKSGHISNKLIRIIRRQVPLALCAFSSSPSCKGNSSSGHLLSGSGVRQTPRRSPSNLGSYTRHLPDFWQRSGHLVSAYQRRWWLRSSKTNSMPQFIKTLTFSILYLGFFITCEGRI